MDTTNHCPLCEQYVREVGSIKRDNYALRKRVEELEEFMDTTATRLEAAPPLTRPQAYDVIANRARALLNKPSCTVATIDFTDDVIEQAKKREEQP